MNNHVQKSGFSLMEVNLAIFVISMGMLTLFSLFPAGLRQVADSQAATQEALFANFVLSTIRAEARLLDGDDWVDMDRFENSILANLPVTDSTSIQEITFGTEEQHMRFKLSIEPISGTHRRGITLWCKAQEFGPTGSAFEEQASTFHTEVAYSGMP